MNTPILRMSRLVGALFAILLISATLIQFVQAPTLRARSDNRRTLLDNYSRARGAILVGETAIASSTPSEGELAYLRSYPQGQLYSHVTGYYSYVYGAGGGLEGSSDGLLSGSSDALFYKRISDLLTGKQATGASLALTLNPKAQAAASKALGNQRGAVVALDPRTGAILALVSHPEYDPNSLSTHDAGASTLSWKAMLEDPTRPLVNRAISGNLYPPGSPRCPTAPSPRPPRSPDPPSWISRKPPSGCPTTTAGPVDPATSPPSNTLSRSPATPPSAGSG